MTLVLDDIFASQHLDRLDLIGWDDAIEPFGCEVDEDYLMAYFGALESETV